MQVKDVVKHIQGLVIIIEVDKVVSITRKGKIISGDDIALHLKRKVKKSKLEERCIFIYV